MRIALCAALGVAWAAGTGAAASSEPASPARTVADTTLASKLVGKWTGTRHADRPGSPLQITMDWTKAPDGHLTADVHPAGGAAYQSNVVWSSDTGFVAESAPHRSAQLKEEVVTRMVGHLKGDSLWGRFELRPTSYRGRTETGRFAATRQKQA